MACGIIPSRATQHREPEERPVPQRAGWFSGLASEGVALRNLFPGVLAMHSQLPRYMSLSMHRSVVCDCELRELRACVRVWRTSMTNTRVNSFSCLKPNFIFIYFIFSHTHSLHSNRHHRHIKPSPTHTHCTRIGTIVTLNLVALLIR